MIPGKFIAPRARKAPRLTQHAWDMLRRCDPVSLPGDGLRISGRQHQQIAGMLVRFGYARLALPPGEKARVHITKEGRERLQCDGTGRERGEGERR